MYSNKTLVKFIRDHGVQAIDCGYSIAILDISYKGKTEYRKIIYLEPDITDIKDYLGY